MENDGATTAQTSRIRLYDFIVVVVQLGLILTIAFLYRIELDRGFSTLAILLFVGFLIHSWLPPRFRLLFFILLTVTGMGLLLQWAGVALALTGAVLIALCHLRVAWCIRVGLIVAAGCGLAVLHMGWGGLPSAKLVVPILGSMFMFRIILYLYDLKKDPTPAPPLQRVAYFFLLPNVFFPLFPVVDYRTFIRTYYDEPAAEIYQRGLVMMYRGVGHLLLYRLVYHLLPRADDLTGVFGVYVFMAMTYGLYLRISGLFHLIVGSLCLFGFNLPRTNDNYFLASSFTDLWRRINIYWKDFMTTVVFYPVILAVRSWSMARRMVIATTLVFAITWFFHSYQWFWLRGEFPVTAVDLGFWGLLGLALAINSALEARHGRRRTKESVWSWPRALIRALKTLGLFSAMAAVWTLWYADSVADWGYRFLRVQESRIEDWGYLALLITSILGIGVMVQWFRFQGLGREWGPMLRRRVPGVVPVAAVILLVIWSPISPDEAQGSFQKVMSRLQSTEPNRLDRQRQERGYYEVLSRSTGFDVAQGDAFDSELALNHRRMTSDLRGAELIHGSRVEWKGSTFSVNQWGMRDREYQKSKPPSTYRIALLGASYEMGSGVGDHETFENLVEDRLNAELGARGGRRFEVLNFGVGGYSSLQQLYVAERNVASFEPDLVLYTIHPDEKRRNVERLHLVLKRGARPGTGYEFVAGILREARAGARLPRTEFLRRLQPHSSRLLRWTFGRQVEVVREYRAIPAFVFMPLTDSEFPRRELEELLGIVSAAGGLPIVLENPYGDHDLEVIRVAEWDNHPNALGHRLIADDLHSALMEHAPALGLIHHEPLEDSD